MARISALLAPALLLAAGLPASAQRGTPVGFVETFALAEDRGATLQQLVPGTEEHFFYSGLHFQQQGELDRVDGLLRDWRKQRGSSGPYRQIETRQRLLRASTDPEATYEYLERELGLGFDHRRVESGAAPDLPTAFDESALDRDAIIRRLLRRGRKSAIREFSGPVLESLVRAELSDEQRGELLDRLPRANVPGLTELIVADLAANPKSTFGSRKIHAKLTLDQLETLRRRRPALLSNRAYVDAVLRRIAPGRGESMDDLATREAYLERALRFAALLPDAFNSLKAHLLYRRIVVDLERGQSDRERLMRYLRLPRLTGYLPLRDQERRVAANLGESYGGITPFDAVGDDRAVVVEALMALMRGSDSYEPFLQVLPESFVQAVWAETRLLYGEPADVDALVRMLGGPDAAERLRDRVEIEFARTNGRRFGADDAVTLAVDVKNVETLMVKVFEIDAVAYFDRFQRPVSASLDLDGLVANVETTIEYREPPLRRVRRTLELEALSGPGTYIIELIGGGVSSRAVVRKGELHLLERIGSAGHVLQVIDGSGEPVPTAIARFGGRDFAADERGEIVVPFTTEPGRRKVLLRGGGVSAVASFGHAAESYGLEVAMHAVSESLIAGETARVVIRPTLLLNGERVSLELLENASLLLSASDQDGTSSTKFVQDLDLEGTLELVEEIEVPERLAQLTVQLTGTVRSLSAGEDVPVVSSLQTIDVNGIAVTADVAQALLTRTPAGYAVDVRGRNGEPLADREVRVEAKLRFIDETVTQNLKTDAAGRVHLGRLAGVASISVSGPPGASAGWGLGPERALGLASELRGRAGADLLVPYAGGEEALSRESLSLLELRGDQPLRDRFDALASTPGYLVLRGLAAGDYQLVLKDLGETYDVRIADGAWRFGHVVGERAAYEVDAPVPLSIRAIVRQGEDLVVQLGGARDTARVHVVATRFRDRYDPLDRLFLRDRPSLDWSVLVGPESSYESGRPISDEYRYILDRRLLDPFPGNMLARAGLLLNPWKLRDTADRMADAGESGGLFSTGVGGGAGGKYGGRFGGRAQLASSGSTPELDFLAEPGVFLTALVPDESGRVTIPIEALGAHHMIRIVAVDDRSAVARDVTRDEQPIALRDRRLIDSLDPSAALTQQRRIAFLRAGEAIELLDAPNANARTFDTLADIFRLYRTMNPSDELAKFEFLTRWPSLSDEEKRAKYSEYVCHELNAFVREKDPAFFADVVAPYIANKGHRTFMDDWLLDEDLAAYLEPWRFERLNVVEKILLLRRVEGRAEEVVRDLYGLVPRGTFSLDAAFDVVLASGGIDTRERGLALAIEQSKEAERKRRSAARSETTTLGAPAVPGSAYESTTDDFFLGRGVSANEVEEVIADAEVSDSLRALGYAADEDFESESLTYDRGRRPFVVPLYRDLDPTREYAETHYWRTRLGAMNANLVTVSPFWVDFAAADGPFVSDSFPLATRSHTEMLLALAFLDLPFEAGEHEIVAEGRSVRMTAASPLLLALEDIAPAALAEGGPSVLVGQDFFRLDDRTETVDGVEREKFVNDEFLVGVPYGCRMVVTNPSSGAVELQALVQIPEGAMALAGSRVTRGQPLTLPAYGTVALETVFYFPEPGTFRDYPIHAGHEGMLLGAADARTLTVVSEPTNEDRDTWEWISQNAELADALAYLERNNPRELDLGRIAWRMKDRAGFEAATAALASRNVFAPVLWQYAIKHRDVDRTREYLATSSGLIARVEAPFDSPLLSLDRRERGAYEHLAYEPLINGRTHEFGGERRILNDQFAAQYAKFLRGLALRRDLRDDDRMEIAYYMLLQDRIGEAIDAFDRVERDAVETGIQYDYMAAYMDFYRGDVEHAREVATPYVDHPIERWRNRFRNVVAHLDEIEGIRPVEGFDRDDRDETQGRLAGSEPILELEVESGRVALSYERLSEVELRYHLMDVEFLFSTNPFVRGGDGAFGFVQPNATQTVELPVGMTATSFAIPDEFRRSNLFVEVRGGGIARRATYFAGSVDVQGLERFGQVRVVEDGTAKPLPRAYVKVYARLGDGSVRFHKDGYTDLRGRFDYVSVSGFDGQPIERFAVLVMHDEAGATVTELAPPVQ
ncbi:MAG: hypothetical protein AAF726_11660 [Planctomycetota bacterium]